MLRFAYMSRAFLLFFIFFTHCSYLKKSCSDINWYEVGRQDSATGVSIKESINKKQRFCSMQSRSLQAYQNGFFAGLREYCSFEIGYTYGLTQSLNQTNNCPEALRIDFIKGYQTGLQISNIQKLKKQIQSKIANLNSLINTEDRKPAGKTETPSEKKEKPVL